MYLYLKNMLFREYNKFDSLKTSKEGKKAYFKEVELFDSKTGKNGETDSISGKGCYTWIAEGKKNSSQLIPIWFWQLQNV